MSVSQSTHEYEELKRKFSGVPLLKLKKRPINRFRALVRFVMEYRPLLEEEPEEVSLNVARNEVVVKKGQSSFLSSKEKAILLKPANQRTPEEIKRLQAVVSGLKCFRRYPEDVRQQLAAVTYIVCFGPDRMLVRQGDRAHALYFILHGEVLIAKDSIEEHTGKTVSTVAGKMRSGDMFGEVSLLHDIPRTATIISTTTVELLMLLREDFSRVLEATLMAKWDEVQQAMKLFPYFNDWNHVAVRECCILSKIKAFVPDQTILGDGQGSAKHVYFVLHGKCQLIQDLHMAVSLVNGRVRCRRLRPGYVLRKGERMETHFMQVSLLGDLQCFGLGENMVDRRVVAISAVECLICPRYWIMQNNQSKIWSRILCYLRTVYPTTDQLFSEFIRNRRWITHRRRMSRQFSGKVPVNTNIHDVPISIRVRENIDIGK